MKTTKWTTVLFDSCLAKNRTWSHCNYKFLFTVYVTLQRFYYRDIVCYQLL